MNQREDKDILLEIIEVFVHCILYIRKIYPEAIFRKKLFYKIPVFVSIYPPLNLYITNVLRTAKELLKSGQLHLVEVILYDTKNNTLLENYTIEIGKMSSTVFNNSDDQYLFGYEQMVRSFLLQLDEKFKNLESLPTDTTFQIYLHTTESAFVKISQDIHFPWLQRTTIDNNIGKYNQTILPLATDSFGVNITAIKYS